MTTVNSVFCYGSLMAPQVIARVLYGLADLPAASSISLQPAILPNFSRSRIVGEAYPAAVPSASSSIAGVLVENVSDVHLARLDEFEGDEYERQEVKVVVAADGSTVDAHCYIWIDRLDRLETIDWDFDDFVKNRLKDWIEGEMASL
ncbi:Butirosin biosynthesis, BtrG-like protein [Limtongia smithiae]|uniref:Butirosin biosynthesis, BtrG-like protein n=1 Tax=Limtongia smithiae TaxID=1125753 RepID=UPI0034CD9BC5